MYLEEKSKAKDHVDCLDDIGLVSGHIEHKTTEAPYITASSRESSVPMKPSTQISVPISSEMTAPVYAPVATKKNGDRFARYVAGFFWLVRTSLGLTDPALWLIEIIAQTFGTPHPEPLNLFKRAICSVREEPVESGAAMNEHVESRADKIVASNHSTNDDTNNFIDVTDEPILKAESMTASKPNISMEGTEFRDNKECGDKSNSSEREAGIDEDGPKKTEVVGVKDFKKTSSNYKNMEEFEEEFLRRSFSQAVKDLEPIKLKTYEKRVDDIMDDFKTEDETLHENSYCKGFRLDEPSTQSSFYRDQHCPLLLEQTFLGPPVPSPTSTRRYPGFRHLFVYEPYQTRYGNLGPVEDLLDDLITEALQLSSSEATSTSDDNGTTSPRDDPEATSTSDDTVATSRHDDPADYHLLVDSFGSSFESN